MKFRMKPFNFNILSVRAQHNHLNTHMHPFPFYELRSSLQLQITDDPKTTTPIGIFCCSSYKQAFIQTNTLFPLLTIFSPDSKIFCPGQAWIEVVASKARGHPKQVGALLGAASFS